jgi:hypothetical protein
MASSFPGTLALGQFCLPPKPMTRVFNQRSAMVVSGGGLAVFFEYAEGGMASLGVVNQK